ncbi:ankyrin repeat domain-containing protein [soil metagenome]
MTLHKMLSGLQAYLSRCVIAGALMSLSTLAIADAYDDFMLSVKFNDVSSVQKQLRKGMDPNSVEALRGETVMMIALREKSTQVFSLLLAQPEIKLEARANNGDTALMIASFMGNLAAVNQLIAAGAELNRPGWTALHYAAANGDSKVISVLLAHSAYIDAQSPNKTTPLMMAVRSGKILAVQLLLSEGADIRAKNELGMTAFDFAMQFEQKEIAEYLQSSTQSKTQTR